MTRKARVFQSKKGSFINLLNSLDVYVLTERNKRRLEKKQNRKVSK
jgi:hypothetical protein